MTSRPRTYRMVVDGEAWPSAVATLRTSAPALTALVAKVQQDGDQGADAGPIGGGFPEPAGLGGVQRSGVGVVAVQLGNLVRSGLRHGNAFGGGVAVEGQHRGEFAAAGGHLLPGGGQVGEPAGGDPRSPQVSRCGSVRSALLAPRNGRGRRDWRGTGDHPSLSVGRRGDTSAVTRIRSPARTRP